MNTRYTYLTEQRNDVENAKGDLEGIIEEITVEMTRIFSEQFALLKKHPFASLAGISSGVATSLLCVFALSLLFGLDHASYVTLLPKSITSAIGVGISQKLGGVPSLTVAVIILSGIFGSITCEWVFHLLRCRTFL